ncbi:MAG: hypothetical protein A2381_02575 [Bdellovibrionales bacterium RIFOXYB1_FULL_37_110]|nr:MAG: hypothetical protein A2417_06175 [Bdellovibrionales bacterium RIFOXYC1_FULL_37_79]OFZ56320.1 MAG: hypothetical protein A2328_05325 [Bdellovibrionales bacterium RIFOXYB2_FULL_36_6]OFZ57359.1 MAG: hypothetical protein A2381_02575 [Bdellovibrionales bacterium RIFOXYB1_FULL_37_110]HAB53099.1 hypothetical protein [Ignavibacteriales bacterium]
MDILKFDDYRRVLKEIIEEFPHNGHGKMREIVDPSPCEEFYCFNMDWFKVSNRNQNNNN